ncbi:sortase [Cryobacterium sp. PH29-G1]|uniref:sortase n=1 Tax=Cryobacterium sp. PH29-G1 TaxID=3046211 RepID=UPI0024BB6ABF|nr:sortase [Cryobacterium sp. PH29-G1]MDJ0351053.1 sortase [Cryobacterium sp. PH29-G1]
MFKKSLATAALAVIAVFAFAPAANAVDYVADTLTTVSDSTPAPGEAVTVAFAATAFGAGEAVTFSAEGTPAATLSVVKAAVSNTVTKTATAAGAVSVVVTVPTDATGAYTVTGTGTSGTVGTAVLTVVAADAGAPIAVDNGLATTGYNAPVLVIWGAAGVLVLGVALLLVRISVRRQHAAA